MVNNDPQQNKKAPRITLFPVSVCINKCVTLHVCTYICICSHRQTHYFPSLFEPWVPPWGKNGRIQKVNKWPAAWGITEERGDSGMQEKWEMKGWTKGGLAPTPNYTDTRDKLQLTEYLQQSRKHFLCPLTLQRWLQALPCNWAVKKRKGSQNKHLGGEEGDGVYKNWEQMCHRGEGWTREEPFLMSWWLETIIRGSAGRKLVFLSSSKHNSYVASTLTFSPSRTHCPHSDVFLAS